MTPDEIETLFTGSDGRYGFARWGRPIVPVVFGVEDATVAALKGALEAVVALAGHGMAETDPELGVNLMVFFLRDWNELTAVPDLDRLVPGLGPLVARLDAGGATNYRLFRFDADGAIRACFVFIRVDDAVAGMPAETLALGEAVQVMLTWSDRAFAAQGPLGQAEPGGPALLKPGIAGVIRAAYDPVMPAATTDPAHALRLAARLGAMR